MATLAIDEVRSLLSSYLQGLDKGASAREIIDGFRKAHAESVSKASHELVTRALIKLLSDIGNRQPSTNIGQLDLFAGYSVPKAIVIPAAEKDKKSIHKPIGKATIFEAEVWLENHEKPRFTTPPHVIEVRRMLEFIKSFTKDFNTTIEDALRKSRGDEERKTA